jgi:hypothetical protein
VRTSNATCSSLLHGYNNWHLLKPFPNVWTFPQFHTNYWMSVCYDTEMFFLHILRNCIICVRGVWNLKYDFKMTRCSRYMYRNFNELL